MFVQAVDLLACVRNVVTICTLLLMMYLGYYVNWIYQEWHEKFRPRKKRTQTGCASHGMRPKLSAECSSDEDEDEATVGHEMSEEVVKHLSTRSKAKQTLFRRKKTPGTADSDDVDDSKPALTAYSPHRLATTADELLNMDHVHLEFWDFLWGMFFIGPNTVLLTFVGVAWLIWRQSLQKLGLISVVPYDPRRLLSDLVLESYRAMHYKGQQEVDGKRIATFVWRHVGMLDGEAKYKEYDRLHIEIDLDEKLLKQAFLDDQELSPDEAVVLVNFNTIFHDHVKIHSMGNWAANVEQKVDPYLRRMSVISVLYNYFGVTCFPRLCAMWHTMGVLKCDFGEGIKELVQHGFEQGVPPHSNVKELAPDSALVDFTVKLRNTFLNQFGAHRQRFAGIDGEALFAATVIHSLDHQCLEWNVRDPLWLEIDKVRDEFKPMANMGRFVRVGFTSALPFLMVNTQYRQSTDPFFQEVYLKAKKLNKRFADQMDTCIVR